MRKSSHDLVSFFREAAPYIHKHRGKTFLIALSGQTLSSPSAKGALSDIALLSTLGVRIILVHGVRSQIEEQIAKSGCTSKIHSGLRVTDKKILDISKMVIGSSRLEIESYLNHALNKPPVVNSSLGVVSGNFLTAKPLGVIDGVDYQFTGKVRKINSELLKLQITQGNIALVSPLGYSPTGQAYNLRYEEVAGYIASHLEVDKLIFLHQNHGLPKLSRHTSLERLDQSLNTKKNTFLKNISQVMHNGVGRVHLIDIEINGGLLLELYTRDGVGSMLSAAHYDEPRKANTDDINGIMDLIRPLEIEGTLIQRTRKQLELDIKYFSVIERDGLIVGCAALYPFGNMGELSCLAIHGGYRSGDRGQDLLEHVQAKAQSMGLESIFVLTTQSADWFLEKGFKEHSLADLPEIRQRSYNKERNSKVFISPLQG